MLGDHIMGVLNGWNITLKCISNFHPPILLQHIKWLGLQIEIEATNQVASHHLSMTKTHPTRCSLNKATKRHKKWFSQLTFRRRIPCHLLEVPSLKLIGWKGKWTVQVQINKVIETGLHLYRKQTCKKTVWIENSPSTHVADLDVYYILHII